MGTEKRADCDSMSRLEVRPIGLKAANRFVEVNHRHHKRVAGCKFSICACKGDVIVGVAICGRPVSRHMDDGTVIEINRLCTDGTRNACSLLYGACCRIAKDMGYRKIVTYTLKSENGASLKASNFICEGEAGGEIWTGERERQRSSEREENTVVKGSESGCESCTGNLLRYRGAE